MLSHGYNNSNYNNIMGLKVYNFKIYKIFKKHIKVY